MVEEGGGRGGDASDEVIFVYLKSGGLRELLRQGGVLFFWR